jgi:hypothetical protein
MSIRNAMAILALTGLAVVSRAADAQVTNYETQGNLAALHPLACSTVDKLKDTDTPPDLYAGFVDCGKRRRYEDAVYFFALAGVYSYFDAQRVADDTAHQAHSALTSQAMDQFDEDTRQAVFAQLKITLGDPAKLPTACAAIERIGPPNYKPDYMIQHGMNAVIGKKQDNDGLVPDFDPKAAWRKSLDNYLHCH